LEFNVPFQHKYGYIRDEQKLGVIRTLLNRCENVVTEEEDRRQEEEHIVNALKKWSYPAWSIRKAKKNMQKKGDKRIKKASQKKELKSRGMITIPYVKGLSEAFSRILKTYRICTAVRPHTTLRNLLVHPKDKSQ